MLRQIEYVMLTNDFNERTDYADELIKNIIKHTIVNSIPIKNKEIYNVKLLQDKLKITSNINNDFALYLPNVFKISTNIKYTLSFSNLKLYVGCK